MRDLVNQGFTRTKQTNIDSNSSDDSGSDNDEVVLDGYNPAVRPKGGKTIIQSINQSIIIQLTGLMAVDCMLMRLTIIILFVLYLNVSIITFVLNVLTLVITTSTGNTCELKKWIILIN